MVGSGGGDLEGIVAVSFLGLEQGGDGGGGDGGRDGDGVGEDGSGLVICICTPKSLIQNIGVKT